MRDLGLASVQEAQEFKRLTTGAYICKITAVEDVEDKEYLKVEYDVADGEFKDYYKDLNEKKNFWGGKLIRSYKESAKPFFKSFVVAVENSNSGYKFDNDEKKLVGKLIGLVLAEEEYKKNDGTIGVRLYVANTKSVADIKKGGIDIPQLKRLAGYSEDKAAFTTIDNIDEDLPF